MSCSFCSTELPTGAMFCGECGHAVVPVEVQVDAPVDAPSDFAANVPTELPTAAQSATAGTAPLDLFPLGLPAGSVEIDLESPILAPAGVIRFGDEAPAIPASRANRDIEQAYIAGREEAAARFVLQFSTGESVTVSGTGILGRNPTPEPGEYFDALVTILDPGRSVSKTHLEFGQEAGSFWLSDRYSGNGTVVRDPELAPVRCEAGKRYFVVRGSRVDIGEQFFVLS